MPGRDGLLDQLEPGPAAHHEAGRRRRGAAPATRAPTTLSTALWRPTSSRTTSSSPVGGEEPGGVDAAGAGEGRPGARAAAPAAVVRRPGRAARRTTGSARGTSRTASMLSLPQTPQADPAPNAAVPVAGVAQRRRAERDGDDVELLLRVEVDVGAVGDGRAGPPGRVSPSLSDVPGGELEVVARRAHGDPDPPRRRPGPGQPDLERLLGREPVLARGRSASARELLDPGALRWARARRDPSSGRSEGARSPPGGAPARRCSRPAAGGSPASTDSSLEQRPGARPGWRRSAR